MLFQILSIVSNTLVLQQIMSLLQQVLWCLAGLLWLACLRAWLAAAWFPKVLTHRIGSTTIKIVNLLIELDHEVDSHKFMNL